MAKRIGVHLGTAGGASNAVERARDRCAKYRFRSFLRARGCGARPKSIRNRPRGCESCARSWMWDPRNPLMSYLVNVCSQTSEFREKSVVAFRGEIERALALGAEYLVLHPGSWKGLTREEGLRLAADSIQRAIDGAAVAGNRLSHSDREHGWSRVLSRRKFRAWSAARAGTERLRNHVSGSRVRRTPVTHTWRDTIC